MKVADEQSEFLEDLVGGEGPEEESVRDDFGEAEVLVFRGWKGFMVLVVVDETEVMLKGT